MLISHGFVIRSSKTSARSNDSDYFPPNDLYHESQQAKCQKYWDFSMSKIQLVF